jgi:multiple sugar transport system substrate-binding protein
MPTQRGQTPGKVTMSGGWLWSIASNAANPDLAWQLLAFMQNVKNATAMNMTQSTLAVRGDVAAAPDYVNAGPVHSYCTDLVQVATYRPALPVYPRVSTQIQEAMESVTTGSATVEQAAKAYDAALPAIVDGAVTTTSGTR